MTQRFLRQLNFRYSYETSVVSSSYFFISSRIHVFSSALSMNYLSRAQLLQHKGLTQRCLLMAREASTHVKTAGVVIIGDEILKGQTQDTNTYFLAQNLRQLGVGLERVSVIPDDLDIIAAEVKNFSEKFDYVLTSGGIGPTHDDITFEGVAKAFDRKVEYNPTLVDLCKAWFKTEDMSQPCFKMALLPSPAKLNFGKDKVTGKPQVYPIVSVGNVFIFPGINCMPLLD